MKLTFLSPVYAEQAPFASVYVDTSPDIDEPDRAIELRWRHLKQHLQSQGADPATVEALAHVVGTDKDVPLSHGHAVFAAHGRVLMAEELPEPPVRDSARLSTLPDAMPVAVQHFPDIPYIAVEAWPITEPGRGVAQQDVEVEFQVGRWPTTRVAGDDRESRHVPAGEWRQGLARIAEELTRAADDSSAELIVLSGDTSARGLLAVASYDDILEAIKTARRRRWKLRAVPGQAPIVFNGMLGGLRRWARAVGLLRGHRNRVIEQALADLRNSVAHPAGPHLGTPVDAARKLFDIAEIINQLWGHPTPGGRLFPAPIRRQIVAISWTDDKVAIGLAEFLDPDGGEHAGSQWVIVRASYEPGLGGDDLFAFDSRHEVGRLPVELLYGPGSRADALAWYAAHQPQPDAVDPLDRMFLIRHDGPRLWLPMRPEIVAALPATEHSGTWYAIVCDDPMAAWRHASNLVAGTVCDRESLCSGCGVQTVLVGDYAEVAAPSPTTSNPLPADVRTPGAHRRYREV